MAKDLRTFINQTLAERPGDILVVDEEVDPKFGVTGIAAKLASEKRFPAVLCRKVKGSRLPLIINLTATYERLALALGTTVSNMVQEYAFRLIAQSDNDPLIYAAQETTIDILEPDLTPPGFREYGDWIFLYPLSNLSLAVFWIPIDDNPANYTIFVNQALDFFTQLFNFFATLTNYLSRLSSVYGYDNSI